MNMSPYKLRILLYYYGCCDDPPEVTEAEPAPILSGTMTEFVDQQLLIATGTDSPRYSMTERGTCYVQGLLNVPLPKWTIPCG